MKQSWTDCWLKDIKPHMWQLNREWKIKREKARQEIIENKKKKENLLQI